MKARWDSPRAFFTDKHNLLYPRHEAPLYHFKENLIVYRHSYQGHIAPAAEYFGPNFNKEAGMNIISNINNLLNHVLNYGKGSSQVGVAVPLPARLKSDANPSESIPCAKSDSLNVSDASKILKDLGIDLKDTTYTDQAQMFDLQIEFTDEQIKNVSANGSYDYRSQSLKVDFSFLSAMSVIDPKTGKQSQQLFKFDFHLEASNVQAQTNSQSVEKEDILHFARKILQTIAKLHSEGKSIDGLVLNQEDLKDLSGVDGGKLLKSMVMLIDLMRTTDNMLGKANDHVLLKPERWKSVTASEQSQESQSISMSLSVQQVSLESEAATPAETQPPEQTAPETPQTPEITNSQEQSIG